jgi:chromosome segregation protein
MLGELSRQTQFIVITHNRQTVQTAEAIYGVTMGDDSVSRLISLKLDEYEKEMAEV